MTAPADSPPPMDCLVLAHGDSFIRAAMAAEGPLLARGFACRWWLARFGDFDPRSAGGHLAEIGFGNRAFESATLGEMLRDPAPLLRADVILAALPGGEVRRLVFALARTPATHARRPIVASLYNGVAYENAADGYLSRAGTDVVAVNGPRDLARFRAVAAEVGLPDDTLVATGLLALDAAVAARDERARTRAGVLFAAQPTVPASREQRAHLLDRLADWAEALGGGSDDPPVILKPRMRPTQIVAHRAEHHDEALLHAMSRRRALPKNLVLSYEPIGTLMGRVGLCVSVSSTAVLEAIARGLDGALLADFGLPDSYGGDYFAGSGLTTTLDRLIAGQRPVPDAAWLAAHLMADGHAGDRLADAIAERVRAQRAAGAAVPWPEGFGARSAAEIDRLAPLPRNAPIDRLLRSSAQAALALPGVRALARRAARAYEAGRR